MLYADDTILLAESPEDLQKGLDAAFDYCRRWHLTVNIDKTKTVVFSKGKLRNKPQFKFGEASIETIEEYLYLGVNFNFNSRFNKARARQIALSKRAKKLTLPIDIQVELYDQLVLPIRLCG